MKKPHLYHLAVYNLVLYIRAVYRYVYIDVLWFVSFTIKNKMTGIR